MSFEEVEEGDEHGGVVGAFAQIVSPDSGQVKEAPGPHRFIERCGEGR